MAEALVRKEQAEAPVSFFSQKKFLLMWGVSHRNDLSGNEYPHRFYLSATS